MRTMAICSKLDVWPLTLFQMNCVKATCSILKTLSSPTPLRMVALTCDTVLLSMHHGLESVCLGRAAGGRT